MDKDPLTRIADGYGAVDPATRPRRRVAESYKPSPYYENLLQLKRTDPAAWRSLPSTEHIALGLYEAQKAAHEAEQENTE